ncbi:hypothetical protein CDD80_5914 [Ophiocordyceps camponoti-rufipedis]|uniref:Cytochrome P450 n=1 Tax=Ophiocordyceps camponoti-rufipedis TaxID=2004952 RepID=A0A2C5ZGH0_9HYPO|nr:hypothetical protein CDD80_5914 [Ophiocordyceps camponoti-rufipedis]
MQAERKPPEDFITWMIRLAISEQKPWLPDPTALSKSLLPIEFASLHTTVLTGHSWMLDLLTMPASTTTFDLLSDEMKVHGPADGLGWSKPALQSLIRLDSSIRESQRLSNFSDTLLERVVVSPAGLVLPGSDFLLPPGIHLTVNLEGTHHDESLYRNALAYNPLRYAHLCEEAMTTNTHQQQQQQNSLIKPQTLGMVSTSNGHLAFGHGLHACPGRFFVAHELKLIMAHLLRSYEFRHGGQRPRSRWIGPLTVPPMGVCIEVRRRRKVGVSVDGS